MHDHTGSRDRILAPRSCFDLWRCLVLRFRLRLRLSNLFLIFSEHLFLLFQDPQIVEPLNFSVCRQLSLFASLLFSNLRLYFSLPRLRTTHNQLAQV